MPKYLITDFKLFEAGEANSNYTDQALDEIVKVLDRKVMRHLTKNLTSIRAYIYRLMTINFGLLIATIQVNGTGYL